MGEIFDKLYNEYLQILNDLVIGYGFSDCDIKEVWNLIQLLYYIKYGNPDSKELLWIAEHYETASSFIEDLDFDENED